MTEAPTGGWQRPTAAYVHVPFCRHRCGYCNFSVIAGRDDLIARFLEAIDRELESLDRPKVRTVFLGGGTPTHLSEAQLEQLLQILLDRFDFEHDLEWSIEANPEDITLAKLDLLVAFGLNRISLGVQSFDNEKLRRLERGHDGKRAADIIERVAERIPNLSIDLIFGVPGESVASWRRDVETAISLPIQHLSTYALTFEKGTSFWTRQDRGLLKPIDESDEVEMYQLARQRARQRGLEHYEISNFAVPGSRCRHNLAYWEGVGWYAAGPGAARFVAGVREVNHRSSTTYLRRMDAGQDPVAESEAISLEQYARERAAFGIRMISGIDLSELSRSVGFDVSELCHGAIERSVNEGLLSDQAPQRLRLTERGILFADTVASRLLG